MITLLGENAYSADPSVVDLEAWAAAFGLNHPVVADPGFGVTFDYAQGSIALPSLHLIGPGMEVLATDANITEQDVIDALP